MRGLTYCSDRQPVPDNQEAFLTSNGPFDAKLIFEIAEYINPHDQLHTPDYHVQEQRDIAAVKFYMEDLTNVTNDTWMSVKEPRRKRFGVASMNQNAAYYLATEVTTRSSPKESSLDALPGPSSQPHSWLHLLFVRLPEHGSDFVVHMNVKHGRLSAMQNLSIAEQTMFKIAETLDFSDFEALIPKSANGED